MTAFVMAFNDLDWEPFRKLWIEAPVMFLQTGELAVVTFHLGSAKQTVGRRMFVVARQPDRTWKLTHLHASNVAPPVRKGFDW